MRRSITRAGILALFAVGLGLLPAAGQAAVLRQFVIPVPSGAATGAEGIVTGSDGGLWFTESGTDRIGRLSTGGTFTDYPLTPGSDPLGIAAGPDGALWFTEASGSRIGRITTAGGLAEYPLTPGSRPVGIAAGADGGLWFTEFAGDRIGRVATDGTVTEYPLSPGGQPVAITLGPDGRTVVHPDRQEGPDRTDRPDDGRGHRVPGLPSGFAQHGHRPAGHHRRP